MEATLDPTTGDVNMALPVTEIPVAEVRKSATRDKAVQELLALREAYFPSLKTPGGKQFGIFKVSGTSLLRVQWMDGGVLPKELSGMYTQASIAQAAIKEYLTKCWDTAIGTIS